ncbi:MAG TPA: tryptophan synthase subunit alpha, partial [Pseudomonadales bacterium]|nr:tryptophan synthase subunit alpha [Pseudomonadales bacterium]
MSRLAACFASLSAEGKKALVPFITAGDPTVTTTVPLMHALVEAGADIIELGIPFSDPMADGPVIQLASERALANGVRLVDVIEMVREFRAKDTTTPIVLMGYLNPVEVLGYERVAELAAEVG